MNNNLIFFPVLVQILLTIAMFVGLAIMKVIAIKAGDVDESKRALHSDAWPPYVLKFSNNISNQFETPVLFYVLCCMLWALGGVNMISLTCAWAYVVTRLLHAYIHTGSNYVPYRKHVFLTGVVFLLGLTIACIQVLIRQM